MAATGHPFASATLSVSSALSSVRESSKFYSLGSGYFNLKCPKGVVRMRVAVEDEQDPAKQVKEMAAARRRWDALIREQKVMVLTPREAGYAIQLSDTALLDVRPSTERQKAWVKGSTWIPIFEVDNSLDFGTVSKKITSFTMGGWWSGVPTLVYDKDFISKVESKFPKESELLLSIAACEQLYNAGYRNLFWVQGGLETAEEEDFQREGPQPFKLAGIGGVSEFFGWTDQQRIVAAKEGWGYRFTYTARLIGLIILVDALFLEASKSVPCFKGCSQIDTVSHRWRRGFGFQFSRKTEKNNAGRNPPPRCL
ncbi:unnamed protein product [Spirodela intermedia]|uniref:Rhodanese domain-containing protein n=1 Tax=Spirodela intermedia TaxID=51605 RepID=A0A7I8JF49_SPIIN|nr:unnamed protein product [Spirodela intermedia]CAA6668022.1 unnamed protein product [Spirodela intermedia]